MGRSRDEYGDGKLNYAMFGAGGAKSYDSFDLRTFQNYSWSFDGSDKGIFLRDQFSRDTQLAMGHQAERGDYYHLYINGQYWGLYNSAERPDADYAASYFGGDEDDYDVVKVDPDLTEWAEVEAALGLVLARLDPAAASGSAAQEALGRFGRIANMAAHVVGKLLKYVGEDRVLWGTDSIWFGSPQDQIQAFRAFQISEEFQERLRNRRRVDRSCPSDRRPNLRS